jgi:hypothetical protein
MILEEFLLVLKFSQLGIYLFDVYVLPQNIKVTVDCVNNSIV